MMRIVATVAGATLLGVTLAWATPPGPGQPFDCSAGGTTSCATDDTGCVSNTFNHFKCSSKIGKAFAKAVNGVISCHAKQATMRFQGSSINGAGTSEENSEENPGNSAKGKLDAALAKLTASGLCDTIQLANAATEEAILFGASPLSLDGQNAMAYCDSSSAALIGDDDSGFVPNDANMLKCEVTVAKAVGKLVAAAIKCHDKMNLSFFKGVDFDEEGCEETIPFKSALAKFNKVRDKLAGLAICPSCQDTASLDAEAASALSQLDTANAIAYPCGLAP